MLITERSPEDENSLCSFCDENTADALWMGKIDIFACRHCASELLPQLMADAIVGGLDFNKIKSATGPTINFSKESRIIERFHSAFSSALLRKMRSTPKT